MTYEEALKIIKKKIAECDDSKLVGWVAKDTRIPDGLDVNGEPWFLENEEEKEND